VHTALNQTPRVDKLPPPSRGANVGHTSPTSCVIDEYFAWADENAERAPQRLLGHEGTRVQRNALSDWKRSALNFLVKTDAATQERRLFIRRGAHEQRVVKHDEVQRVVLIFSPPACGRRGKKQKSLGRVCGIKAHNTASPRLFCFENIYDTGADTVACPTTTAGAHVIRTKHAIG